ncbi:MAG: heavy metal translocating P-type ATPase [Mariprofundaceae bacterium]
MADEISKACFHCGLALSVVATVTTEIEQKQQHFCCAGCAQVCQIIYASGLASFYDNAPSTRQWTPPEQAPEDAVVFDHIEVQADFVRQYPDGTYQADLLIEGIHCPACVWLIEHTLSNMSAVTSAEVNFTRHRLRLRWEPESMRLSEAIIAIGQVGYRAIPYQEDVAQQRDKQRRQDLMFRMAFGGFVFANVMTAAVCLYAGDFFGIQEKYRTIFQWYSMVLTLAGIAYSGRGFFVSAWQALAQHRLNMDVPICLGIGAGFLWSVAVTVAPDWLGISGDAANHVYYDSVSMFIFLILVGRFLESSAREIAGSATRHLLGLLPRSALKLHGEDEAQLIPLRSVRTDDVLRIKPGDRIPVDGAVVFGVSDVDESMISGEAHPVGKKIGSRVVGGTLNLSGHMHVRATNLGHQSVLECIVELIEQAQTSKVKIQRLADRIVPWFVGMALFLSVLTLIFWYWQAGVAFAVMTAVTVLIITCPCALGLATPMAIAIGAGLGGKLGVLIKRGAALESLVDIDHVVFDKTGTLSEGHVQVLHGEVVSGSSCDTTELWAAVHAVEQASEHAFATAIAAFLKDYPTTMELTDFTNYPGRGVRGRVGRATLHIGSLGWLKAHRIESDAVTLQAMQKHESLGRTIVVVFDDAQLLGWLALGDALRQEAASVVRALMQSGKGITLLTGDRIVPTQAMADQLLAEIEDESVTMDIIAEVMPGEKADQIKRLQERGLTVAMVGDGINDAPALMQADVGIAMGQATDISAQAADMVLLGGLDRLPVAMRLSRQTMRTIKQNLALSLGYNALAVPLAMAGMIQPLFAAIAMPVSSLLVIANALLIKKRMS